MTQKYKLLFTFFTLGLLFLLSGKTFATVGGPSYISQISYNASAKTVYYIENDHGGRGCPPIVHTVSLGTGNDSEVKNCNEIFEEYINKEGGEAEYIHFVAEYLSGLPYLGSVSLKNNNIEIGVNYLSEHREEGYLLWGEFEADIRQDGKEIGKINFRGCYKEQPHVFEGYMIPDSDAMAILISNKGDCFEGGYLKESLHLVKGIKYYDTRLVRGFKDATATEPNMGNEVVYAASKEKKLNAKSAIKIAVIAGVFIAGSVLGYMAGRKHSRAKQGKNS